MWAFVERNLTVSLVKIIVIAFILILSILLFGRFLS
jgi:hypothetical protein